MSKDHIENQRIDDRRNEARPALLDRRLLVVTGKGGVGKTTVAAGLALLGAALGKRTLACEIDAKGDLAAAFDLRKVGFDPVAGPDGVRVMAMDTEASLREYLRINLHLPLVARLGPLARTFDFVADAAPGVKEILSVGKLAWSAPRPAGCSTSSGIPPAPARSW